jgi:PEP-CTERM motif-containing protein
VRKLFGGALAAMILTCVGVGTAAALTFTDIWDPSDIKLNHDGETYTFTHNIIDNGFQPLSQTVTSADIYLAFEDDKSNDEEEWVKFKFDSGQYTAAQEIDTGTIHFLVNAQLIQSDGKVEVTLQLSGDGDVYFDQSKLVVEATPTPTPEPTSLLLLGSGLAGLAFTGRKKIRASRVEAVEPRLSSNRDEA